MRNYTFPSFPILIATILGLMATLLLALIAQIGTSEVQPNTNSLFAEKCYTCHGDEVASKEWEFSGHKHALTNLIEGPYKTKDSCLSCHSAGYDDPTRNWGRKQEITLKTAVNAVSCSICHSHKSHRKHYLKKSIKSLCTSCHKMDCGCAGAGIIHQSQSEMFLGRNGAGVKRMPSPHAKVMKKRCVHCHMVKETPDTVAKHGGHTFKANFSTCKQCHEDMGKKLRNYKTEMAKKMQAVKMILDQVDDRENENYKQAKLNYDMVKGDSGYGLHNIIYANALLDYSLSLEKELIGNR
ncbi:TPA: hypothetical protein DHW51_04330 [Candidatus Poribacteria bacterium]|nr:hypothetical protein [Candidatus Poribacteria bacterium]